MMDFEEDCESVDYDIPADKLYAVVELSVDKPNEEGESDVETYVCPASTNWLKDVKRTETSEGQVKYYATCMWPKHEAKLSLLLEKRSKPANDWIPHTFTHILKFCRSIGHAKEQAKKAMYKTLSESDNLEPKKRPSVKPSRFGFSVDWDAGHNADNDDTDSEAPPIKSLKIVKAGQSVKVPHRQPNNTNSGGTKEVAGSSAEGNPSQSVQAANYSSSAGTDAAASRSEDNNSPPASRSEGPKETKTPFTTSNKVSYRTRLFSSPNKRCTFSPRKVTNVSNPLSHATFVREMQEIRQILNGLKVSVNKLYNCVCPIVETSSKDGDRGMPGLPVDSFEEMSIWEKFLQDHDNALNVVRLLTERCVLTSLKDSVYSMLRFILSNRLASSFNYKGKNKKGVKFPKASFLGSRSCTALNAAIKAYQDNLKRSGTTLNYSSGPTEVGAAIGLWLKDAPKRYLIELKSSKKVPETETKLPDDFYIVPPAEFDWE